jgi:hypothetical protein
MRSPAEALLAPPSWGVPRRLTILPPAHEVLRVRRSNRGSEVGHAIALATLWIALWTFFLVGVAWPGSRLHAEGARAAADQIAALAAALPR